MQTKLQTEQYNGVIIFWDKSKIFITKKEMELIKNIDSASFEIKGSIYSFNQISKILYLEEYYNQYPDERPQEKKFLDIALDNNNKDGAYKNLYSSKRYCERTVADFTRIIAERKEKGLPFSNIIDLLKYAKMRLIEKTSG